jgi:hypothetical protein
MAPSVERARRRSDEGGQAEKQRQKKLKGVHARELFRRAACSKVSGQLCQSRLHLAAEPAMHGNITASMNRVIEESFAEIQQLRAARRRFRKTNASKVGKPGNRSAVTREKMAGEQKGPVGKPGKAKIPTLLGYGFAASDDQRSDGEGIRIPDLCFCKRIWVRSGVGRVILGAFCAFLSLTGLSLLPPGLGSNKFPMPEVGAKLPAIRQQWQLSLREVEQRSRRILKNGARRGRWCSIRFPAERNHVVDRRLTQFAGRTFTRGYTSS